MVHIIIPISVQIVLLFFLLFKDKNDGEKDLFRKQRWSVSNILITILLFNIFIYITSLLKHIGYLSIMKRNVSIYGLIVFLSFLLLYRIRFKQDVNNLGVQWNRFVKIVLWILCIVPIAICVFLNVTPLTEITNNIIFRIGETKTYVSLTLLVSVINLLFMAIIITPITEESIYRGVLYSPFRKKFGPKIAILINSVLFGIVHIGNPLPIFLKSLLICWVYEKRQSLSLSIIIHIVLNAIAGIYSFRTIFNTAVEALR